MNMLVQELNDAMQCIPNLSICKSITIVHAKHIDERSL